MVTSRRLESLASLAIPPSEFLPNRVFCPDSRLLPSLIDHSSLLPILLPIVAQTLPNNPLQQPAVPYIYQQHTQSRANYESTALPTELRRPSIFILALTRRNRQTSANSRVSVAALRVHGFIA